MDDEQQIATHYTHGQLMPAIEAALKDMGLSPQNLTLDDLSLVDEFHIGGRGATQHLMAQLALNDTAKVLDIGCGLGGAARFVANGCDAMVTGIDLTKEYIDCGNTLSQWVNLADCVTLVAASATSMPFTPEQFDAAYMMHVGMNIEDKQSLFEEVNRVLCRGAQFGIYDVMRQADGEILYPVPWASDEKHSYVATANEYCDALQQAGFDIVSLTDRRQFALDFFETVRLKNKTDGGPLPLGLHTIMQQSAATKLPNLAKNIANGVIAPVELIVRKR